MEGQVVKAGEPVLLRHVNTNIFLAADEKFKIKNDFGSENEVHCHNHSTNNKSQNLALEQEGRLTVDVPTKFQQNQNLFILHTAPDASYARSIKELSKFDINEAMRDLKQRMYDRSCFGAKELCSIFQAMDKKGDQRLDVDDFRWGLMDYGVQVSKEDAQELQAHFDSDGLVNWREFLNALKGDENWNDAREAVVRSAFEALDENKSGSVTLDQMAQRLDPTHLPCVSEGRQPEREAYLELMGQFNN